MARLRSKTGTYDQGIIASSSAPSAAFVGQIWFNSATGVTYQWTTDGASNFWLDISSSGIGTSAGRGVDYVGDTDPKPNHNGGSATLSVGQVYYNREKNRHFICADASNNANSWSGRFDGAGGKVVTVAVGGTYYRVHTFLSSATFYAEDTLTADYLIVAGGGGGGNCKGTNWGSGGGGGAGGMLTAAGLSVTATDYPVVVGAGGRGGFHSSADNAENGGNSSFKGLTSIGGGKGGSADFNGSAGGSGGGSGYYSGRTGGAGTSGQGNAGGDTVASGHQSAGGGGGKGAAGQQGQGTTQGGNGGVGEDEVMGLNAADSYTLLTACAVGHVVSGARYFAGGGGGSTYGSGAGGAGGSGGGGAGATPGGSGGTGLGGHGLVNTGGGGGGAGHNALPSPRGGDGGSGIVIIRYAIT